jgi:hypothetical protein
MNPPNYPQNPNYPRQVGHIDLFCVVADHIQTISGTDPQAARIASDTCFQDLRRKCAAGTFYNNPINPINPTNPTNPTNPGNVVKY